MKQIKKVFSEKKKSHIPKENVLDLRQKIPEDFFAYQDDQPQPAREEKSAQAEEIIFTKPPRKISWWESRRLKKKEIKPPKSAPQVIKTAKTKEPKSNFKTERQVSQRFWLKNSLAFVVVALVIVTPIYAFGYVKNASFIKDRVLLLANNAYENLLGIQQDLEDFDIDGLKVNLEEAVDNFTAAQAELENIGTVATTLAKIFPSAKRQLESADGLLECGKQISLAASELTQASSLLADMQIDEKTQSITTSLSLSQTNLAQSLKDLKAANVALLKVDPLVIPAEQREEVILLQTLLPKVTNSFSDFYALTDGILEILGHSQTKRYLLLFQNNREARATGGFISSLALVDISKGQVTNLEIPSGGAYDFKGQLLEKVIAPEPLHLVNPHWQLQDSNWWPDFPTSAAKAMWFYEKSGGPTVDGVITFTPTIFEEFLKVTGPVDMQDDYGVTLTADNFLETIETFGDLDETGKPKQFIADVGPKILNTLLSNGNENWFSLLNIFTQGLLEKHILLYFSEAGLESQMQSLGWAGEIKDTNNDYLMVVNTNIGGGKTDGVIDQVIEHSAEIRPDGSIIDTVKLKRIHHGVAGEDYTGVKNIDYVRFYVPEGAELIQATGFDKPWKNLFLDPDEDYQLDETLLDTEQNKFIDALTNTEIYNSLGKTVFGNWIQTEPGETSEVTISYRLPFGLDLSSWLNIYDSYSLLVQKQPGSLGSVFQSEVSLPNTVEPAWVYPANGELKIENQQVIFEDILLTDDYYGLVVKNKK